MVLNRALGTLIPFLLAGLASCTTYHSTQPRHAFAFVGFGSGEADYVDLATIRSVGEGDELVWLLRVYDGQSRSTYDMVQNQISCRYRRLTFLYRADFGRDGALLGEGSGDGTAASVVPGTLMDAVYSYACFGRYALSGNAVLSEPFEAVRSGQAFMAGVRSGEAAPRPAPPYP